MPNDLQAQIDKLRADLEALNGEMYTNNFSALQDFNKYSRFKTALQVPVFASNPTKGAVGDVVCVGGKFKMCTVASATAPTWTIVGTQT
jgi:hypothetical protein